jgi:DNA-binding CsgD family transcriptional regulator
MADGPSKHEQLTPREEEILRLAREGLSNREIAEQLALNHNALRFHLKHLHAKLFTGGQRAALADGAGSDRRWGWLPFAVTGWLAPTASVVAVVAVSAGGYLAVRAANESHNGNAVTAGGSPAAVPTTILAAMQPTLADIAQRCHLELSTLEQLNAGIHEPLTAGQEVVVPVNEHCQSGMATSTLPASPTLPPGIGGDFALFGSKEAALVKPPAMTHNVLAITPKYNQLVKQADTQTADRLKPQGVCTDVTLDASAPNLPWFRMAVDDAEVTSQLVDVVHTDKSAATLCYAPAAGLERGTHYASVVVVDPSGQWPVGQRVARSFDVVP